MQDVRSVEHSQRIRGNHRFLRCISLTSFPFGEGNNAREKIINTTPCSLAAP